MKGVPIYFFVAFVLHLGWENAQAPLYADFIGFADHFLPCLWGTITGDMILMGVIYLAVGTALGEATWSSDPESYRHPATWILSALIGVLLAVSYELWAIHAVSRWQYGTMPIIPVVRVGLTPVLQMIVVPFLTFAACSLIGRRQIRTL